MLISVRAEPAWASFSRGVAGGSWMISAGRRTTASCLTRCSPRLRGSFPARGIATPAAQRASAKCSSAADTPAAAPRRRIVTRRRTARRGPARRSGVRRSEPPRHIVPRRTTRDISRRHPCPQPHRPSCLRTSSSRTGLPGPALIAASSLARAGRELGRALAASKASRRSLTRIPGPAVSTTMRRQPSATTAASPSRSASGPRLSYRSEGAGIGSRRTRDVDSAHGRAGGRDVGVAGPTEEETAWLSVRV